VATVLSHHRPDPRPPLLRYRFHASAVWAAGQTAIVDSRLESISKRRTEAHAELLDRGSAVYRAFLEFERTAFAEGELSKANKELIALGISVVIDCESCMQWHIEQAASAGASERQVLEAVEVGMEMGGGPATARARFALQVMAEVFGGGATGKAD
jgi:AhpD family alkylhydroperoxidase